MTTYKPKWSCPKCGGVIGWGANWCSDKKCLREQAKRNAAEAKKRAALSAAQAPTE